MKPEIGKLKSGIDYSHKVSHKNQYHQKIKSARCLPHQQKKYIEAERSKKRGIIVPPV